VFPGETVSENKDEQLRQIEATQERLKQSIERSRQLVAEAQRLLERHRGFLLKH